VIAIIDYKAGNLTSVRLGLEYIGVPCEITDDPAKILSAERVIFPGVGAAGEAMRNLNEPQAAEDPCPNCLPKAMDDLHKLGLIEAIRTVVAKGTPFMGICLGTQIIFEYSEEDGGTPCIGLVPGSVKRFTPADPMCKIPQMGWNTVAIRTLETGRRGDGGKHPLFEGIEDSSEFYFVHSYYPAPSDPSYIIGETEYAGVRFASAVGKGNLFATQFHPERSGRIGLKLLENFSRWDGKC
jgi:imidazole glycerol-phosphate synthase subunit HisH